MPRDEGDVRADVKTAAEYNVNILPRGAGVKALHWVESIRGCAY